MKAEVFIRVDGGPQIGLGHLVRCTALADMLKNDFNITFYCREIPESLKEDFQQNGFQLVLIGNEEQFFDQIDPESIVVLDGYGFDTDYQRLIKATGAKLVCVDDLHDKEFVADLIINHAPGVSLMDYKAQPYTQFALGLEYALLRPAFLEQAKEKRKVEKMETLLIAFGGADPKGLTEKALEVTLKFREFRKIIVVTGASFPVTDRFAEIIASDPRILHSQALSEKEMLDAMLEAELALVPASGVLFEVLAAGTKAISGCYAENQRLVYAHFKMAGAIIDAGNFEEVNLEQAIRKGLNEKPSVTNIFDGESKQKIQKYFALLQKENEIMLRPAGETDLETTFDWATNKEIRRYAFQTHQISHDEHTQWFLSKINNPNCIFYIGEISGKPFGSIRFDIKEGEALISYLVDPDFHGQHLGQILLKKGIENLLLEEGPGNRTFFYTIVGFVMKTNMPSIKAFDRMGFEKTDLDDRYKFVKTI